MLWIEGAEHDRTGAVHEGEHGTLRQCTRSAHRFQRFDFNGGAHHGPNASADGVEHGQGKCHDLRRTDDHAGGHHVAYRELPAAQRFVEVLAIADVERTAVRRHASAAERVSRRVGNPEIRVRNRSRTENSLQHNGVARGRCGRIEQFAHAHQQRLRHGNRRIQRSGARDRQLLRALHLQVTLCLAQLQVAETGQPDHACSDDDGGHQQSGADAAHRSCGGVGVGRHTAKVRQSWRVVASRTRALSPRCDSSNAELLTRENLQAT